MKQILKLIRNNSLTQYFLRTSKSVKILVIFTILACGPMPIDYNEYFSLFYPEAANNPLDTKKYFFSFSVLNDTESYYEEYTPKTESLEEKVNLDAWEGYLNKKISRDALKTGLYEIGKMGGVIGQVQKVNVEAATYLKLCKSVDELTLSRNNYWEAEAPKDNTKLQSALDRAILELNNSSSTFLKERYLYQAIKLAASLQDYQQVLTLYEASKKQISQPSFISSWSRARAAGATMALGDTATATYEFAQLFYAVPTRRAAAERSLVSVPNKYFEAAQKLCKSNNSKANLLAVAAIQRSKDGLEEIKQIYELDPQHAMLELIFAREINKNENTFFAEKNIWNYSSTENYYSDGGEMDPSKIAKAKSTASSYLKQLQDFAQKVAKDNKVKSVNFWNLSDAYFYYLQNNKKAANDVLASLNVSQNPFFEKQINFLRFEMADKSLNPENEKYLVGLFGKFAKINSFRDNNMKIRMAETLHDYYNQKSEKRSSMWGWLSSCSNKPAEISAENKIKGFLALNAAAEVSGEYGYELSKSQDYYVDTCSVDFLNKVLAFIAKPNNTPENIELIKHAKFKPGYLGLALARQLVIEEKYDLAIAAFKKIDVDYLNNIGFTDYFYGNPRDFKTDTQYLIYDEMNDDDHNLGGVGDRPLAFLEVINNLKLKAATGNPQDLYDYGKALYNLSYYGDAWLLVKRSRSDYEIQYDLGPDFEKNDYYTTQSALTYFKKAALSKPDAELGAKIAYGGALCERNQYWVSFYKNKPADYDKVDAYVAESTQNLLPKYRSFFKELSTKYKNTQYNKLLLQECSTYAHYIN